MCIGGSLEFKREYYCSTVLFFGVRKKRKEANGEERQTTSTTSRVEQKVFGTNSKLPLSALTACLDHATPTPRAEEQHQHRDAGLQTPNTPTSSTVPQSLNCYNSFFGWRCIRNYYY
ncbi:hypothetical protein BGY98DRAFT_369399 [Russula aff. rugulosa BPL654]|nr:hypothetical protein BGY98DRAFT_369399 [Russula aff. rugulosa BPL654]